MKMFNSNKKTSFLSERAAYFPPAPVFFDLGTVKAPLYQQYHKFIITDSRHHKQKN
jgi:hypothetical protein